MTDSTNEFNLITEQELMQSNEFPVASVPDHAVAVASSQAKVRRESTAEAGETVTASAACVVPPRPPRPARPEKTPQNVGNDRPQRPPRPARLNTNPSPADPPEGGLAKVAEGKNAPSTGLQVSESDSIQETADQIASLAPMDVPSIDKALEAANALTEETHGGNDGPIKATEMPDISRTSISSAARRASTSQADSRPELPSVACMKQETPVISELPERPKRPERPSKLPKDELKSSAEKKDSSSVIEIGELQNYSTGEQPTEPEPGISRSSLAAYKEFDGESSTETFGPQPSRNPIRISQSESSDKSRPELELEWEGHSTKRNVQVSASGDIAAISPSEESIKTLEKPPVGDSECFTRTSEEDSDSFGNPPISGQIHEGSDTAGDTDRLGKHISEETDTEKSEAGDPNHKDLHSTEVKQQAPSDSVANVELDKGGGSETSQVSVPQVPADASGSTKPQDTKPSAPKPARPIRPVRPSVMNKFPINEPTEAPKPKPKPKLGARIAALQSSGMFSDLSAAIARGPIPTRKKEVETVENVADNMEEQIQAIPKDLRARAKGPKRRLPAAAKTKFQTVTVVLWQGPDTEPTCERSSPSGPGVIEDSSDVQVSAPISQKTKQNPVDENQQSQGDNVSGFVGDNSDSDHKNDNMSQSVELTEVSACVRADSKMGSRANSESESSQNMSPKHSESRVLLSPDADQADFATFIAAGNSFPVADSDAEATPEASAHDTATSTITTRDSDTGECAIEAEVSKECKVESLVHESPSYVKPRALSSNTVREDILSGTRSDEPVIQESLLDEESE